MIGFLASRFIKDYQNTSDAAVRRAYGVLCGAVGIAINLLLFALKLFAGTLAGSVAVTADAFNNLSDAGSSVVTLVGFKLAGQKADDGHPFGRIPTIRSATGGSSTSRVSSSQSSSC